MSDLLPRLRADLEINPSPIADRPGVLLRDPYRYSDAVVVVPPALVPCLLFFDGAHAPRALRDALTRITGGGDVDGIANQLVQVLSESGFLVDGAFQSLRARRQREFGDAPIRAARHAGGGYPDEPSALASTVATWLATVPDESPSSDDRGTRSSAGDTTRDGAGTTTSDGAGTTTSGGAGTTTNGAGALVAIAAPHVSPEGGPATYGAAYRELTPDLADRTFVILGTSHYGRPHRFGLTRKPFQTPLGTTRTNPALFDELLRAAPQALELEDYCHAVEHSIEFQVLFLQSVLGPDIRILPILCGPFLHDGAPTSRPEDEPVVARALNALGELGAKHGERLVWVLGVDMAHVGRRYGDDLDARVGEGDMLAVAARDRLRLDRIAAGDADGFWRLAHERGADDLKWCGSAPLYSFLRAVPEARGTLLHYDQWNIDPTSVVSFSALRFTR